MPRARLFTIRGSFLCAALACLGSFIEVGQGRARAAVIDDVRLTTTEQLYEVSLPGGLRAAVTAIRDYNPPDRSQFLLEVIRRVHNMPSGPEGPRDATLAALLAHLASARDASASDMLPLPLAPSVWTTSVFGGQATVATLASDILRSRSASFFYVGLLSVDAGTRAFIAERPDLVTDLSSRLAAGFVLAAPGLRVDGGRVALPGGERAAAAWAALVGKRLEEPPEFLRAMLWENGGRVAWFCGSLGQLTPAQLDRVLDLDAPDVQRVAAMRRLYEVFLRVAGDWRLEHRTFWRPALDPSLLAAWLPADANGRPVLPGTRAFWQAVFADAPVPAATASRREPLDFPWLAEQVFAGPGADHRRRLQQVLLAARLPAPETPQQVTDTGDAIRGAAHYPALIAMLDRLRFDDAKLFALAAKRANELSALEGARGVRALVQFQGLLALVARSASRGGMDWPEAQVMARSLIAVELAPRSDYAGRLVDWLDTSLASRRQHMPALSLERLLLQLVAGPAPLPRHTIEWEGSRYRVDLAAAEIERIQRLLGEQARPWLTSAHTFAALAADLTDPARAADARVRAHDVVTAVAARVGWTGDDPDPRQRDTMARFRELIPLIASRSRTGDTESSARVAATLRSLADDLFARGVLELVYAVALGQSDRAWITADAAAAGHDFGMVVTTPRHGDAAWRRPVAGADQRKEWRATGSLLGLDVSLAELGLVRLSNRPPLRRPTINEEDRRAIVEMVALAQPSALADADRVRLVAAIARGRARLAAVQTPADAEALASAIRLSTTRRTLLAWTVAHEPSRTAAALSPLELLWLGQREGAGSDAPVTDPAFDAWGVTAEPISGCLCLRLPPQQPWEITAGRWGTGLFASTMPDLSLRLAELLAGMQMPSELLAPVLPSAALDLANTVAVRGQDDRRSFIEFVQALTPARVEQYLALLTTGGALVPLDAGEDVTATRPGAPR